MEEIRCGECRKKLAEGVYSHLVIKCPRCGVLNHMKAQSLPSERQARLPLEKLKAHEPDNSLDRRQTPPL